MANSRKTAPTKHGCVIFLPSGNDINTNHQRTVDIALKEVQNLGKILLALYNRVAKTLDFRTDLYTGFNQTGADWKLSLLRLLDTRQARYIAVRGHGFDDGILNFNQTLANEPGLDFPNAETLQAKLFNADQQQF